jgi:acetyl-CoA carboxylase carboxyl transferase subunit alpha
LWKDSSREKEAAELMKISAEDLLSFGICERVIAEPEWGAAKDVPLMARYLREYLGEAVSRLAKINITTLLENRYGKFRKIGQYL